MEGRDEKIIADTDVLMRTVEKLPYNTAREKTAALLLAAATVATKNHRYDKKEFLRGVNLAWRLATGKKE